MFRLLCDTNQMAFGSSSALLAILQYLPSLNTVFSYGITAEVFSQSELIHEKLNVDNKDENQVKNSVDLLNFDAVLVVSNLTNINWYLDFNISVIYVDLHSWWHPTFQHRIKSEAALYFVENFFEQNEFNEEFAIKVGPIITIKDKKKLKHKKALINVGGGKNKWIEPGVNSNYSFIVAEIVKIIKPKLNGYKIYIAGGSQIIEQFKKYLHNTDIEICNYSQDEYLNILEESEFLISSPGLNAIFEGIYYGNKIVMLPPQNASQIIQLKYYENFGLINKGLNLDSFYDFPDEEEIKMIDEEDLTIKTLNALRIIETSEVFQKDIFEHVINQISDAFNEINENKVNLAKEVLGPPGAEYIGERIIKIMNSYVDTTVVIPTKALRFKLLDVAIKYVINNTRLPKEILIVVDNNISGFEILTNKYKFKNFIRVFHNEGKEGVSATRNFGVKFVSTQFISFLDDDDYWENNYLETIFNEKKFDIALVGFKKKKEGVLTLEKLPPTELNKRDFLTKNPGIRGSNITISKKLFIKIAGFNEILLSFNDMDFGFRLSTIENIKYKSIRKHLVIFNSHNGKRISTPLCKENKQGIKKFIEMYRTEMTSKEFEYFRTRTIKIWKFDPLKEY